LWYYYLRQKKAVNQFFKEWKMSYMSELDITRQDLEAEGVKFICCELDAGWMWEDFGTTDGKLYPTKEDAVRAADAYMTENIYDHA
jgi:hypothetical protein